MRRCWEKDCVKELRGKRESRPSQWNLQAKEKKHNGVVTVISDTLMVPVGHGERRTDAGGACKSQLAHAVPPVLAIAYAGHPGHDILRLAKILSKGNGPSALVIMSANCCWLGTQLSSSRPR